MVEYEELNLQHIFTVRWESGYNAGLLLVRRVRRWSSIIKAALGQCLNQQTNN